LLNAYVDPRNGKDFIEVRVSYGKHGATFWYDSFFPEPGGGASIEGPSGCLHMPDVKEIDLDGDAPLPAEAVHFINEALDQLQQMRMATVCESDYRPSQRKLPKARDQLAPQRYDVLHLAELCAEASS